MDIVRMQMSCIWNLSPLNDIYIYCSTQNRIVTCNKATGLDKMPSKVVKLAVEIISDSLTYTYKQLPVHFYAWMENCKSNSRFSRIYSCLACH